MMIRLYAALLHLYPAAFRREYSEELCRVFARRMRSASGVFGAAAVWVEAVADVVWNGLAVHGEYLRHDLRFTARSIRRAPGFSIAVVLVSALGIGATTAVFTVTDHVLIRPLPFPESHRLVKLWESPPGYRDMEPSPPNYFDWKRMATAFESMGAYRGLSVNLAGAGEPARLDGAAVSADLFPMLGVTPALGRLFTQEDDRLGAAGTLLLSHRLWQTAFGADPGVAGSSVLLDGAKYTVIGVMPEDFHFPDRAARLWTALRIDSQTDTDRNNNYLHVIARLKPGVALEQARQEMRVIAARLEQAYPAQNSKTTATVNLLRDEISSQSRLLLTALFGASICVLLIACTNLANLLLARALARRKEFAVRVSLGAGRERLMRQLLTESGALAALGGLAGIGAAHAALPLLARLAPASQPIAEPAMDLRVLLFALAVTAITGLAFGVFPALRACGQAGVAALREGQRAGVGGRKQRLRSALVAVEVTLSVVLLVSAGLLVRALWRLQATDPGFRAEGVLTLRTALPMPEYQRVARRDQFYDQVLAEVRGLPGVAAAAYASFLPIAHGGGIWPVSLRGEIANRAATNSASLRFITPDYFRTMGIPIVMGRDVAGSDTRESLFVAVVSESFVRRYWPGENPLGKRFHIAFQERTVAGVAGDIRVRGLGRVAEPQVYLPHRQVPDGGLTWYAPKDLVVRTTGEPFSLLPAVRRIIRAADPEQPVSDVRTLEDIVDSSTASRRLQVRVLAAFSAVAFLLAAVGIHGLLSFAVSQRSQEIGVRIALGARPGDIAGMILRETAALTAAAIATGAALAYGAGKTLEALLAGVAPGDAPAFAAAIALTVVMTFAGSFGPTIRAVRVDPVRAIQSE